MDSSSAPNNQSFDDSQSSSDKSNSSISEFVRLLNNRSYSSVTKGCTDSDCSFDLEDSVKVKNQQNLSTSFPTPSSSQQNQYKNCNPTGPKGYDIFKDPIYTNIIWDNFPPIQQSTPQRPLSNLNTPRSSISDTSYLYRPNGFPILSVPMGKRHLIDKNNPINHLRMKDPYLREIQRAIYDVRTELFQQSIDYYKLAENYALHDENMINLIKNTLHFPTPTPNLTHYSEFVPQPIFHKNL